MKRLPSSLLPVLFAVSAAIPVRSAPPGTARAGAALPSALPRLGALPGLPPDSPAPREGQGETEREFQRLLSDFLSVDLAYILARPGSLEQIEADQRRRQLYDRGIGILTREGALLESSAASLERFALEMDGLYSPGGRFTLREQLRGYATLYAWRAFTEATRRELERETDWKRLPEIAWGFQRSYSDTLWNQRPRYEPGPHPPSNWQLAAYEAVRDWAYRAAVCALERDLASGRLSWREMEELAYEFEEDWFHAESGSAEEEFCASAATAAFDAAFTTFGRELASGRLGEPDLLASLERAYLERQAGRDMGNALIALNPGIPLSDAYNYRVVERIRRYRASGR